MDIDAIGDAIATRFGSGSLTAPSGYTTVQLATNKRQKGTGKLPMVVVSWQGTRDLEYGNSRRKGVIDYSARFYYSKAADDEATDTGLQLWHDVLIDRLLGQLMLGQGATANGVTGAFVRAVIPGTAKLGEENYAVLEMPIEVGFTHAVTFTA